MKPRNAYCSFCRKSYVDVGPLVEGPGDVYICGECIELCQSIIEQEKRRRNPGSSASATLGVRARLDQLIDGQEEAKVALGMAACCRNEGGGRVLLVGSSRGTKILLARALAHALEAPFAAGDSSGLVKTQWGTAEVLPILHSLLNASGFDMEAASHGVLYVDGLEQQDAQEALVQLWQGKVSNPAGPVQLDVRNIIFVCGGTFAGLDQKIARLGFDPAQPVTGEVLAAAGARPDWVGHLAACARVSKLDEEYLARIVDCVDLSRLNREPGAP